VEITDDARGRMEELADAAHPNETGGVLVGHYAEQHRLAVVVVASPPPRDSAAGRAWFRRGQHGLTRWFKKLWWSESREYYVGEWHYHPAPEAVPSDADIVELRAISANDDYRCPEPILIVVAAPRDDRRSAAVLVVPRDGRPEHLAPHRKPA
jgi:integrative and conjugative element protein (TIGR02256 family)